MAMKIEEMIAGKDDGETVSVDGFSVPVGALRKLFDDGYVNLVFYKDNKTFALWGKNCSACFTSEQIQERTK